MSQIDNFDEAIAEVERRVAAGRVDGRYPEDLDAQLASQFSRLAKDPLAFGALDDVRAAVTNLRSQRFGRDQIALDSDVPGGPQLHRVVGKVVSRQILGLVQQMTRYSRSVLDSVDALATALEEIRTVINGDLLGDIDAVHHRLVSTEQRLARLEAEAAEHRDHPELDDASPA